MPTNAKKNQPSKKRSKIPDDLTSIKGIGDSLKQWLRDTFKVHTFAEIAALSAQEVETRAKRDGRFLPLSKIEQILAQARGLVSKSLIPATESRRRKTSKKVNDWKEFASFMVYFERKVVGGKEEKRTKVERRTAIHHMETGEQESWSGVDAEQACHWMLHRLSTKAGIAAEEIVTTTKPTLKSRPATITPPADNDWQSFLPGAPDAVEPVPADAHRTREPEAVKAATPSPAKPETAQTLSNDTSNIQVFQPLSPDQLQEMLAQNRASVSEKEATKVAIPQVAVPSPAEVSTSQAVALEVTGIQVAQPSSSDQPQDLFAQNRAFSGYVKGGEPLSFAVKFRLTGTGAAAIAKRNSPFSVVFNAEDLMTSTVTRLGVSRPDFLKDGQLTYTAALSPLVVPPGIYHLRIVTTVRDPQPLWDSTEVPVLQVVA